MADRYVYEGVGNDTTGDGTSGNPWATIAYALTQAAAGEAILFKTKAIAYNLPNFGQDEWYTCKFADPANGTDDGSHGHQDGADAWDSLQYALDSAAEKSWIFCTGTETLGLTIDVDAGCASGQAYKIAEGYTTNPRDGGYYFVNFTGACFHWWSTGAGVVLANIKATQSGAGSGPTIDIDETPTRGAHHWNVWAVAPAGYTCFYSGDVTNRVANLYCLATGGEYGFYSNAAMMLCQGCVADACGYGFQDFSGLVAHRCAAKACTTRGFKAAGLGSLIQCVAYDCAVACQTTGNVAIIETILKDSDTYELTGAAGNKAIILNSVAHGGPSGQFYALQNHDAMFTVDPLFMDAANGDFRLRGDSPLINGGLAGLHRLTNLAPVGHVLGAYTPMITHPSAGRLAAVGNPHGVSVF